MYQDSTGNYIMIGDRVRFRGQIYKIKKFIPGAGQEGIIAGIEFEESQDTEEMADEWSVDLVEPQNSQSN